MEQLVRSGEEEIVALMIGKYRYEVMFLSAIGGVIVANLVPAYFLPPALLNEWIFLGAVIGWYFLVGLFGWWFPGLVLTVGEKLGLWSVNKDKDDDFGGYFVGWLASLIHMVIAYVLGLVRVQSATAYTPNWSVFFFFIVLLPCLYLFTIAEQMRIRDYLRIFNINRIDSKVADLTQKAESLEKEGELFEAAKIWVALDRTSRISKEKRAKGYSLLEEYVILSFLQGHAVPTEQIFDLLKSGSDGDSEESRSVEALLKSVETSDLSAVALAFIDKTREGSSLRGMAEAQEIVAIRDLADHFGFDVETMYKIVETAVANERLYGNFTLDKDSFVSSGSLQRRMRELLDQKARN